MSELRRVAVVMDPPERIQPAKDSTVALMLAAQARGAELYITTPSDLCGGPAGVQAHARKGRVADRADWWQTEEESLVELSEFDVVLMRKDPPVDMAYIAATWLLDQVRAAGVCVLNAPETLRNMNEKLSIVQFADLAPPLLVSARRDDLEGFLAEYNEIVIKPLDRMGGALVYRLRREDADVASIIESVTQQGTLPVMAQRFLPEVVEGDRRLLLIDGELIPEVAVRIPKAGGFLANLAQGGTLRVEPADDRDREIAERLGAPLREAGVCFAGADVVGGQLTEINITSPTCIREVEAHTGQAVAMRFWDAVVDHWLET
ncbi:MAG: glutathione synthase [Gammaproteobacteria bacterium]|nr:glutathione synthase [Gammaproteobacteria bacterium]